jgi:ethanolamine utilization microcompartment shell protein EutS
MNLDSELGNASEESCGGEKGRDLRVRLWVSVATGASSFQILSLETTSGTAAKARFNVATLVGATNVVILFMDRFSAAIAGSGAARLPALARRSATTLPV